MKYKFKRELLASAAVRPTAIISAVRAEAGDPKAMIEEMRKTVQAMRDAQDAALKKGDAVSAEHAEKISKMQDTIDKIQSAFDDQAKKLAAAMMNGNGERKIKDPEYSDAFAAYFKKGSEVQASLNKGTAAEGGFFAPVEWDRTITDKLVRISAMRGISKVQRISGTSFSKLFNQKGTTSGWVGETAARPETATPTIGSLQYDTGEIYANPSATQTMLDDSEVDIETWLAGEVEQEFALQEGKAFIAGNGANGRPKGILTYVTGGANAAAHPYGAITTVNSGSAAAITADGLIKLVYDLPKEFAGNAKFLMNRNSHREVRLLKDGQNNYLWQPTYQAGQPATLLGYPLIEDPEMPDIAAAAKAALFGDFERTYLIIDRVGIRVLRDPFTNKPYVMFYTTKRVGGGLLNPQTMRALNISV